MKIGEAETRIRSDLEKIYNDGEAASIADLMMEGIVFLSKTDRMLMKNKDLSSSELSQLEYSLQRLLNHEPVQYILGKAWFFGMELFVDKNVLIPRSETEELVEWIISDVKKFNNNLLERGIAEADETTQLKILDIGTGSGCIALAIKKTIAKAEVWGCDISEEALNIARRNGSSLDIRVDFLGLDFLDEAQQKQLPTTDIIVCNPPYIPLRDKETMSANVLNYEPHEALFVADNDPLIFYKALADFAEKRLYKNGSIYMEIHEDLSKDVTVLFESKAYEVELKKDMQGKDRMVKARRNEE